MHLDDALATRITEFFYPLQALFILFAGLAEFALVSQDIGQLSMVGIAGVSVRLLIVGLELLASRDVDLGVLQTTTRQLVFLGQDTADQWGTLAMRLEGAGRGDEAIDAYRRAIERQDPPDLLLANRLARLLIANRASDPESVREATELGRQVVEALGSASSTGLQTIAAAYAAAGRYGEAAEALERAAQIADANGARRQAGVMKRKAAHHRARAADISGSQE